MAYRNGDDKGYMMFGKRQQLVLAFMALLFPMCVLGQVEVLERGSSNMEVLGHLPLGPRLSVTDMDIEQELNRPFAYVSRAQEIGRAHV